MTAEGAAEGTEVRDLRVETHAGTPVVDGVSLSIPPGEILGLVGESGSGKTTVGLALLGYCRSGLRVRSGSISIGGRTVVAQSRAAEDLRGRIVFYMPQDPATALNPFLRVGTQLAETFAGPARPDGATLRSSLADVRLPQDGHLLRAFAFELSGGQQQRVALAMAFANKPRLIVMDEPTTGLDVTTQAHVLATIKALCREHGVSALYVSHDLAVIGQIAGSVAVMREGRVVEAGPAGQVLGAPRHAYTQALLRALPRIEDRAPAVAELGPLLRVNGLKAWHGGHAVLHGVDLDIPRGACVALVGESGSGKTTLSRCIAGLHAGLSGEITFGGEPLRHAAAARPRAVRRRIQYIFQNPYGSLNPEHTIGRSIRTVIGLFEAVSRREMAARVAEALTQVALAPEIAGRYPRELSGGQRQRAAIARALAARPDLLVCDEITSALDVSVQARIVELLQELQRRRGLSMLFVTHNLPLVARVAQHILVMQGGRIVEAGPAGDVLGQHRAEETQRLLRDTPDFPFGISPASPAAPGPAGG